MCLKFTMNSSRVFDFMENVEKESSAPVVSSAADSQSSEEANVEKGQRPREKEVFKASRRHLELSDIIKSLHDDLRESSKTFGVEKAWEEHLKNESALEEYAKAMKELAEIWEKNVQQVGSRARSRIKWTVAACYAYYFKDLYLQAREKEERISFLSESRRIPKERLLPDKIAAKRKSLRILDVGSCFNPFSQYLAFDVTAIDLYPADESVHRGDFLKIELEDDFRINGPNIEALPKDYFHAVIFSFLLEYMPSSEQRIKCCKKAYDLLKYEGILIIITPDSQHVGKNVKLMKNWKYTLGKMGYTRIKFEKLPHVTCLIFRKSLDADVAERWGNIAFEPGMTQSLDIPQDKESEIASCLDIPKDKESEIVPCLDISKDKECEIAPCLDISKGTESEIAPCLDISKGTESEIALCLDISKGTESEIAPCLDISKDTESEIAPCLDISKDKESEIAPCLDISKDKQIEETVSSISLCGKESKRKPSLDIAEQPDEAPKLDIPQDKESEESPSRKWWTFFICEQYFSQELYLKHREREEHIASVCNCIPLSKNRYLPLNIAKKTLLDISMRRTLDDYISVQGMFVTPHPKIFEDVVCYEIAETHSSFEVTSLREGIDFLNGNFYESFHCVVINNLLLYVPYHTQDRLEYCRKAYEALKAEGIFVIIALDSGQMRNGTKLMNVWRYTLAKIGFAMIEFRKLRDLVCLVFRKCLSAEIAQRGEIYKEPQMIEYECP